MALKRNRLTRNEFVKRDGYFVIKLYNRACKVIGETKVDSEDVEKLRPFKWFLTGPVKLRYAVAHVGGVKTLLHRFLLNPASSQEIDHINQNSLDNRRLNLRECSKSQNLMNRGKSSLNRSGVKGVYWHKTNQGWAAKIRTDGRNLHLGTYKSLKRAAEVRRQAEKLIFGEYAPQ